MNIATTIVAFYIPVTTMCVLYFQVKKRPNKFQFSWKQQDKF